MERETERTGGSRTELFKPAETMPRDGATAGLIKRIVSSARYMQPALTLRARARVHCAPCGFRLKGLRARPAGD